MSVGLASGAVGCPGVQPPSVVRINGQERPCKKTLRRTVSITVFRPSRSFGHRETLDKAARSVSPKPSSGHPCPRESEATGTMRTTVRLSTA